MKQHPTNCGLVQEHVRNIGRLPLGMFTSPWRKPVMLQSCKVCRADGTTGRMIEPRPTVGEDNTWIRGPSCPKHLPQNLWQLLHHLPPSMQPNHVGHQGTEKGKGKGGGHSPPAVSSGHQKGFNIPHPPAPTTPPPPTPPTPQWKYI